MRGHHELKERTQKPIGGSFFSLVLFTGVEVGVELEVVPVRLLGLAEVVQLQHHKKRHCLIAAKGGGNTGERPMCSVSAKSIGWHLCAAVHDRAVLDFHQPAVPVEQRRARQIDRPDRVPSRQWKVKERQ